ncbi:MAG: anti-sigma F factor [Clostridia bacterium]|nr:anti-sigma F factor [Clostridia bacterium]
MKKSNYMEVRFKALSVNEGFARVCVAGFCLPLNPSVDELGDIKTAVSEAVTNCVVHAYPKGNGMITLTCETEGNEVKITVKDSGIGIKDIEKAREPFFTTKPDEERSGMGFAVMESFMDAIEVTENVGGGLVVVMTKRINSGLAKVENA